MFGTKKKDTGKQSPISAHPLFPAVVALWFAALLGLGSLVLPVTLFEKAVTTTGVSSVVSAAQPPLGTTARIAIAVLAGLAGAVAGLIIARKVVSAQASTVPVRSVFGRAKVTDDGDDSFKKPISAHEELGTESLDEPIAETPAQTSGAYAGKRRALAVTDDSGPSDYFDEAPLPGGPAIDQHVDDLPEKLLEEPVDGADDADANGIAPLELAELDLTELATEDPSALANTDFANGPAAPLEEAAYAAAPRPFYAPETTPPTTENPQAAHDPVAELREEIGTMTDQSTQLNAAPELTPASDSEAVTAAYNPLSAKDVAIEPERKPFATPVEFGDETVGEFAQPFDAGTSALAPATAFDAPPAAEQASDGGQMVGGKPLADLGMVELVERFALALQAKAEKQAEAEETAMAQEEAEAAPLVFQRSRSADSEAPFAPSGAEDAGNAVAEFFASPAAVPQDATVLPAPEPSLPAALEPVGFDAGEYTDEDGKNDDHEEIAPLSLSMNTAHQPFLQAPASTADAGPARPAQFAALDAIDDEDEPEDDGTGFSSLLAMKSPFESGQEFVRVEEEDHDGSVEPTVVFPGSTAMDRQTAPEVDGLTRDSIVEAVEPSAVVAPRPFDAPGESPSHRRAMAAPKANPGETERALRDALEKLQRMSGAA